MIEPHHIAQAGTVATGTLTLADAASGGGSWQTVAINAAFTLVSALISTWLKSRQDKGVKK